MKARINFKSLLELAAPLIRGSRERKLAAAEALLKVRDEHYRTPQGKKKSVDYDYSDITDWLARYNAIIVDATSVSNITGKIIDVAYIPKGYPMEGAGKNGKTIKLPSSKLVVAVEQENEVYLVNIIEALHIKIGDARGERVTALQKRLPYERVDVSDIESLNRWFRAAGLCS